MKLLIQKLPLNEGSSFLAKTYITPSFETPLHQHQELELVLCAGSSGTVFIGDYIGDYKKGEIYLLGENLPHWFRKKNNDITGRALVVQFRSDMLGSNFLALPEINKIDNLIVNARKGIKLKGNLNKSIQQKLKKIEKQKGFEQLSTLLNCLHKISVSEEYEYLTEYYFTYSSNNAQNRIGKVYEYTMNHYKGKITLEEVAKITNKSVSIFCNYFKINTKKTYIQFLNEVRINQACKLLKNSDKTITDICFESGFNNWANFSVQFKKMLSISPREYRKKYK